MAAGDFIREVVVGLVLLDGSAKCGAGLQAGVGRILHGAERIYGLKIPVPEVAEDIAMKCVRTGAGDDVDYAAGGTAIFGSVSVGDDLKFLHGFLRNRRANAVHGIVGSIGAIHVHQVGSAALSAHV